jgi:hypothetical protein
MEAGAGIHRSSNPSQVRPPPPLLLFIFSIIFFNFVYYIYIYIYARIFGVDEFDSCWIDFRCVSQVLINHYQKRRESNGKWFYNYIAVFRWMNSLVLDFNKSNSFIKIVFRWLLSYSIICCVICNKINQIIISTS